ncbi:MAG: FKBP-type peptidyl-prolyl cis-trans isomerase [Psittacicella sp.]
MKKKSIIIKSLLVAVLFSSYSLVSYAEPNTNTVMISSNDNVTNVYKATYSNILNSTPKQTVQEINSKSYATGVFFADLVKQMNSGLMINKLNLQQVLDGFKYTLTNNGKVSSEDANKYVNQIINDKTSFNANMQSDYLKEFLKLNKNAHKTSDGLVYIIKNPGVGKISRSDTIFMQYKGQLINGKVFSESAKPFKIAVNNSILGVAEGLKMIGKGGEVTLVIPASLGYGNAAIPGIPANSTLIFNIKVLAVS